MSDPKPKLLIVEDDISAQQYYSFILSDLYDLTLVRTVEAAKEAVLVESFCLALIDIALPGDEDGIGLIKFLVEKHQDKLPAIVVTANVFPKNRKEAFSAGAVDFLAKPVLSNVLIEGIEKFMLSEIKGS